MSFTLAGLIAAAAPVALKAISDFARENRGTFNGLLKESKPVIRDLSRDISEKMNNEINKYENDGWEKDIER